MECQAEWDIDETRWYMQHFDDKDESRSIIWEVIKIEVVLLVGVLALMVLG